MEQDNRTPITENNPPHHGCRNFAIILWAIVFIVIFSECRSCMSFPESSSSYKPSYKTNVGSIVTIPYLILGTTKSNWNTLVDYAVHKDNTSMMAMAYNGSAFIVEDNTHAKVLENSGIFIIKVRITDGQQAGKIGWLSSELL